MVVDATMQMPCEVAFLTMPPFEADIFVIKLVARSYGAYGIPTEIRNHMWVKPCEAGIELLW